MEDFSHRAQVHLQRILDASGDYRFSPSSSRPTSSTRHSVSAAKPRASRGSLSADRSAAAPPAMGASEGHTEAAAGAPIGYGAQSATIDPPATYALEDMYQAAAPAPQSPREMATRGEDAQGHGGPEHSTALACASPENADRDADNQPRCSPQDDGERTSASKDTLPAELAGLVVRVNAFSRAEPSEVLQNPNDYLVYIEEPVEDPDLPRTASEAAQLLREVPTSVLQNYSGFMTRPDASDAIEAPNQPSAAGAAAARVDEAAQMTETAAVPLRVVAKAEEEGQARAAVEREEAAAWLDLVCAHWKERAALEADTAVERALAALPPTSPADVQRPDTVMSSEGSTQPLASASTSAVDPAPGMARFRFPVTSIDETTQSKPSFTPRARGSMFDAEAQDPLLRLVIREEEDRNAVSGDEQEELFDILVAMDHSIQRSYHRLQQQYPNITDAVAARYPANMSPEAIAVCIAVEQEVIRLRQKVYSLEQHVNYAKEDNRDLRRTVEISERRSSIAIARRRASSVLNSNWDQESLFTN